MKTELSTGKQYEALVLHQDGWTSMALFDDDLDAANRLDEAVAARDKDYSRTRAASGDVIDLGKQRSPDR